MIDNKFDYALDKISKFENISRFETECVSKKFHYNCSSGKFKKVFNIKSFDSIINFALTFQSSSSTVVEVKINNIKVIGETFSNFGFVNHVFASNLNNEIEVLITSNDAIENINIYFFGKAIIKNDDFLFDFNENNICYFDGTSTQTANLLDSNHNIFDNNNDDGVTNLDIAYLFSKNQSLKNILARIYIENNSLVLKSDKSCEVEQGVKHACFVLQNDEQYSICFYKNGNIYVKMLDENLVEVETKQLIFSGLSNVEKLLKVSSMIPLNYFCVISSGVLYLADTSGECRPLCKIETANVFFHDGKFYVFAYLDNVLNLYIYSSDNFSKIKTICLKNYLSGFVFKDKLYAFNYCSVDEINE